MNIKNILIALVFLGVVGLALTGLFRKPNVPEAVPAEEVSAKNSVGDVSLEDSTLGSNMDKPEMTIGDDSSPGMENSEGGENSNEPSQNESEMTTDESEMGMGKDSSQNMGTSSKEETVYTTLLDEQGAVTVEVTPLNLETTSETLDFKIALNTHSVDLSMNLAALATLTTDTGIVIQAITWDAPLGGHHVSGTLSFPAIVDGVSVLDGASKITLTLINVDAPERVFTWER